MGQSPSWHSWILSKPVDAITPAVFERSNSFVMESQYAGFPFQLITLENNVTAFC